MLRGYGQPGDAAPAQYWCRRILLACVRVLYLRIPRAAGRVRAVWRERGCARAEPILELACVVFDTSVAMVALVDGERVFIRNCFGDTAMARPGSPPNQTPTL